MVEYAMEKEVMHITSVNNISRAYVKFVFSRRMEYHVTNTFLQVCIIFPIFHIVQYHFVNFCVLFPIIYFLDSDISDGGILILFL